MKELMSLYDEGDEIMDIEAINEQEAEIDASTPLKKLIERTRAKKKKKFVFLVFFCFSYLPALHLLVFYILTNTKHSNKRQSHLKLLLPTRSSLESQLNTP